jgi:hypothetical protein
MILIETIFINGRPIGKLQDDLHAGRVTFQPADGDKRLATRTWRDVNTATRDIQNHYQLKPIKSKD